MYIIIAIVVFAAIALLFAVDLLKRRHRRRRYPTQPDGIRTCATCGTVLDPGATDCGRCGADTVVLVV
jgi:uncharacterized paraquat-inducible protein A